MTIKPYVDGELLVKFKPGQAQLQDDFEVVETFKDVFQSAGGELARVKLPEGTSVEQAIERLKGQVEYAEPNYTYELTATPNDLHPDLWGLRTVQAEKAWDTTTGANGPVIAVIDTGIDYHHPDLVNNLWVNPGEIPGDGIDNDGNGVIDDVYGYDAYHDTGDPIDEHFHGTHVAGTIAAEGNNGQGVAGLNWDGQIMPVKIFAGANPSTNAAAILRGISYAHRMGARLTNNSWGGGSFSQAIHDAFKFSPALHMCGAGNRGTDNDTNPFYPANYELDNILSVAATDRQDQKASFSCYGATTVDLAAPGVGILSTVPNNGYNAYNGTSMATPHVTGVAGLILSAHPEATNEEVVKRLMLGSDPLASMEGRTISGGRLNAARSVESDGVAPAAPNDLRAVETTPTSATLQWTATGDDAWCGRASAYELRACFGAGGVAGGTAPSQMDEAQVVPTARASATGSLERATVTFEPSSEPRTLTVLLRVLDNVGNASEVRTAQVEVPATGH